MVDRAQAAYVEILEYHPGVDHVDSPEARGVRRPNQLRINGTPILCPRGESIQVHGMTFGTADDDDLVQVTVTMFARRVVIEQRADLPPE